MIIIRILLLVIFISNITQIANAKPKCPDIKAIQASDKLSEKLTGGKVFKEGEVLKVNLPSYTKEVASYIYVKSDGLYYSIFTLVNTKCVARFIKRTNGKY
ncbi:hypothetical protein MSP8887_03139 [Marinomonas spartinae]|uniref:hypothetical protein n=1 Tax=Marinomonas spartinae TaxID=1792290 RepID=UPI000808FA07|nr:hypothetical protein [Marinomonas spartinae]SBS38081.1 hypothetical protein MSP8887_03139 [Marinomonas spartinae]